MLPTCQGKYIFYSYPDAADNSWAMFAYLTQQGGDRKRKYVWLCEEPDKVRPRVSETASSYGLAVSVYRKSSIIGLLHFCSSQFAFTTTTFYPFLVPGYGPCIVGVWHGMPIKTLGEYDKGAPTQVQAIDYLVSTSDFFSEVMAKAFNLPTDKVLHSGLPRNDALLPSRNGVTRNALFEKLGVPSDCYLVFWLPTYRKSSEKYGLVDSAYNSFVDEWPDGFLGRLDRVASRLNIVLVVKLHPADQLNHTGCFGKGLSNIKVISADEWQSTDLNLYEVLAVSDALISDVSSVLIDYMVVGRPIGVTIGSKDSYARGVIPEVAGILDTFCSLAEEADFMDFLARAGENVEPKRWLCAKYNSQAWHGGSACETLARHLGIQ